MWVRCCVPKSEVMSLRSEVSRRKFLCQMDLLAASAPAFENVGSSGAAKQPARRNCNILILKSDEHNPFYSSVYGHPFIETPNMERIARMGTVFENAYCTSAMHRINSSIWRWMRPRISLIDTDWAYGLRGSWAGIPEAGSLEESSTYSVDFK